MKLQPNFSWQKYEDNEEGEKEQFQYQLQSQHIQVANSVNATIDDASYFTRERMTAFTWIDSKPIWKKSFATTLTVAGINNIAHGISNMSTLVALYGSAQDAIPFTLAVPLPYVDISNVANQIQLSATQSQISITLGNNTKQNYLAWVTIEYTKTS
jgi:hypothetical protein